MCKKNLYIETKISITLNIFDTEDFWKTSLYEENLISTKV